MDGLALQSVIDALVAVAALALILSECLEELIQLFALLEAVVVLELLFNRRVGEDLLQR